MGLSVSLTAARPTEIFDANITHNLGKMAKAAGVYMYLWRPDEIGITKASQLIEPLRAGLGVLMLDPEGYREFNPENGWGNYEGLVKFITKYLEVCENNPDADIYISL